jgi:hypothetical protein
MRFVYAARRARRRRGAAHGRRTGTTTKTWREALAALEDASWDRQRPARRLAAGGLHVPGHGRADPGDHRLGQRALLPRRRVRVLHRQPARAEPRPHPPPLARHQRRDRALLRIAEVRAPLPPRDRRRARARRARRGLPRQLQPPTPARGALDFALPIDRYLAVPTNDTADNTTSAEESVSTT